MPPEPIPARHDRQPASPAAARPVIAAPAIATALATQTRPVTAPAAPRAAARAQCRRTGAGLHVPRPRIARRRRLRRGPSMPRAPIRPPPRKPSAACAADCSASRAARGAHHASAVSRSARPPRSPAMAARAAAIGTRAPASGVARRLPGRTRQGAMSDLLAIARRFRRCCAGCWSNGLVAAGSTRPRRDARRLRTLPPDRVDDRRRPRSPQLNLFLYQVSPNQGWRNAALPDARRDRRAALATRRWRSTCTTC